jgi:hypothetical protein
MKPSFYGTYSAIKTGNRGLVVHIPQAFVKFNKIKPGSEISIYMVEDDTSFLLIKAPKKEKK